MKRHFAGFPGPGKNMVISACGRRVSCIKSTTSHIEAVTCKACRKVIEFIDEIATP